MYFLGGQFLNRTLCGRCGLLEKEKDQPPPWSHCDVSCCGVSHVPSCPNLCHLIIQNFPISNGNLWIIWKGILIQKLITYMKITPTMWLWQRGVGVCVWEEGGGGVRIPISSRARKAIAKRLVPRRSPIWRRHRIHVVYVVSVDYVHLTCYCE